MKKTMLKAPVLVILAAIVTIFLLCPSMAFATRTTGTYLSGMVTLDANPVPKGSVVTAWVENCSSTWQTTVFFSGSDSVYALVIPANTGGGAKNGGVNGDIIHFSLTVNGRTISDPSTAIWKQEEDVSHAIHLITPPFPDLVIDTDFLEDGMVNLAYSQQLISSGGLPPCTWTVTNLPPGLSLMAGGIIGGMPTQEGTWNVQIDCSDDIVSSQTDSVTLPLIVYPEMKINTSMLTRWVVEDGPVLPALPGWIKGQPYNCELEVEGGCEPYTFSASMDLATAGLALDDSGEISGTPGLEGEYNITFTLTDSANPPKSVNKTLGLKIYLKGDANGMGDDPQPDIADVTYLEREILGYNAPTAGCDANLDGEITVADITKLERIILGLDQ